jgi:hypothetical protein
MRDICRCSRCGKILINEEFEGHNCSPRAIASKSILLDYYTVSKDQQGREVIIAKDMNGIIYTLTVSTVKPTKIDTGFTLPTDMNNQRKQPRKEQNKCIRFVESAGV